MSASFWIVAFLAILVISGVFSMFGKGGGSLYTPVLVMLGMAVQPAISTALFLNLVTALTATVVFHRNNLVDYRFCLVFLPGTMAGSLLGVVLSSRAPRDLLLALFSAFLYAVGLLRVFSAREKPGPQVRKLTGGMVLLVTVFSFGVGVLSSLIGVGGGLIIFPFPVLYMKLGAQRAAGLPARVGSPLGFLFGFFLNRGDLRGASAFREVLLLRDARKVWGLWVCIVTSTAVFAGLDLMGLVTPAPKPMLRLSYSVGGTVFGAGTVLAGGCVSGCLYKGPAGNIHSIVALIGMPLGMAMVEYGPLSGLHKTMLAHKVTAADEGAVTFSSLTGLPFWALALFFAGRTGAAALWWRSTHPSQGPRIVQREPLFRRLLARPWKPRQAGLAVGLPEGPLYLSSAASGRNCPVGVNHGVLQGSCSSPNPPCKEA